MMMMTLARFSSPCPLRPWLCPANLKYWNRPLAIGRPRKQNLLRGPYLDLQQGGEGGRVSKSASVIFSSQCLYNFGPSRALITSQCHSTDDWRKFPNAPTPSTLYRWLSRTVLDNVLHGEHGSVFTPLSKVSDVTPLPPSQPVAKNIIIRSLFGMNWIWTYTTDLIPL